jgi:hypothetical protein
MPVLKESILTNIKDGTWVKIIYKKQNAVIKDTWFIQNLFKFDCVRSYELLDTLSNPFLAPTSTEQ